MAGGAFSLVALGAALPVSTKGSAVVSSCCTVYPSSSSSSLVAVSARLSSNVALIGTGRVLRAFGTLSSELRASSWVKPYLTTQEFDPLLNGSRGLQRRRQCLTLRSKRVKLPLASPVSQFVLPDLPYEMDALEPHISKQTLEFHWGKHHRSYVDNLNKQIKNTDLERNSLDEIVKISYNNGNPSSAFNNAGQAWNHDFYWSSMKPGGGGKPERELLSLIERDFGDYETFVTEFKQAATTQFGSGWAWLVAHKAKLQIVKTPNAVNPLIWGYFPLLVIDVWEHAYYLDFQNRRPDYVSTFLNDLINWDAAEERLARAKAFMNFGEPNIPEL